MALPGSPTMTTLTVVIPARDAELLIRDCVTSVLGQVRAGDALVVVDDGSSDGTGDVAAECGARVVRRSDGGGPYAARQEVALAAETTGVVFFDARCRALPGWLDAHRQALDDPGTALSAGSVEVVPGQTVASRVVAAEQPFLVRHYAEAARPYFPACNLGVATSAFRAVGGFAGVRSGGDADLCWRIQDAGLGRFEMRDVVEVQWVPRTRMGELLEQYHRYGAGWRQLQASDGRAGPVRISASVRRVARTPLRVAVRRRAGIRVAGAAALAQAAFEIGYRKGRRSGPS